MRACPRYVPSEDEVSDFKLRVMAQLDEMHRRIDLKNLAQAMGATDE